MTKSSQPSSLLFLDQLDVDVSGMIVVMIGRMGCQRDNRALFEYQFCGLRFQDVIGFVTNVGRTTYQKSGSRTLDFYLANHMHLGSHYGRTGGCSDREEDKTYLDVCHCLDFNVCQKLQHVGESSKATVLVEFSQPKEGTLKNVLIWARNRKNDVWLLILNMAILFHYSVVWYKLELGVADDTAHVVIVLFNEPAIELVKCAAESLLASVDEKINPMAMVEEVASSTTVDENTENPSPEFKSLARPPSVCTPSKGLEEKKKKRFEVEDSNVNDDCGSSRSQLSAMLMQAREKRNRKASHSKTQATDMTKSLQPSSLLFLDQLDVDVSGTIVVMIGRMGCQRDNRALFEYQFCGLRFHGGIYSIKNFIVHPNKDDFRVVKHATFMREFDGATTICKAAVSDIGFLRYPFQLVDFDRIKPTNNNYLIDVIGLVTNVGRTTYQKSGSRTLDFYLANHMHLGSRYGRTGGCSDREEDKTCWDMYHCFDFNVCQKLQHVGESSKASILVEFSQPKEGTLKNVLIWARNRKNDTVTFHCKVTIKTIRTKKGWNYPSCGGGQCKKGATHQLGKWFCEACNMAIKYKLELGVADDTAHVVIVLFNEPATELVKCAAESLLASVDEKINPMAMVEEVASSTTVDENTENPLPEFKSLARPPSVCTPSKGLEEKKKKRSEVEDSNANDDCGSSRSQLSVMLMQAREKRNRKDPYNDPMVTPSLSTLLNNSIIIQSNTTIRHDGRVQSYYGPTLATFPLPDRNTINLDQSAGPSTSRYASTRLEGDHQVVESVHNEKGNFYFVYGPGIASLLPLGDRTAHSRFVIPLDLMDNSTCGIKQNTQLVELMQEVRLIICDEAPMNKRYEFKALDTTLRDILGYKNPEKRNSIFGGTIVLLGEVLMMDWLSIVETDKVIHIMETDIVKLMVEIESFRMSSDKFDEETGSPNGLQPKQADLSYVHALNELHLHEIRVVPSKHEADQSDRNDVIWLMASMGSLPFLIIRIVRPEFSWGNSEVLMINWLSIVEIDKVIQTVKSDIVKLVVVIESFGMNSDEFDKETGLSYHAYISSLLVLFGNHGSFFILDKLTKVAESSRLPDKIKVVFDRARSEEKYFAGLMHDLCFSLRISLSKKRSLVADLEVLVEREDTAKSLEKMREIVARDSVTLGDLEKLLARALVGVSLKDGYVADMEEKE
nr:ATP-dependent DNA helicase PIF7-like [Tanacetum cinerariifolium]